MLYYKLNSKTKLTRQQSKFCFILSLCILTIVIIALSPYYYDFYSGSNYLVLNTTLITPIITTRHEWTLNHNVLQYSSILKIDKNGNIDVEALVFLNYLNEDSQYLLLNLKCLLLQKHVVLSKVNDILKIPLMNMDRPYVGLWKIKCSYIKDDFSTLYERFEMNKFNELRIAIVDIRDFKATVEQSELIFTNKNAQIPVNFIKYQIPTVFDVNKVKIPAVVNCVHFTRDLYDDRLKRLFNWLEIQKRIGVKNIKFYFYELNENAKNEIMNRHEASFVQVIDYKTNISDVCKYEIESTSSPGGVKSKVHDKMLEICKHAYNKHFTMSRGYTTNAHERLNTNDCFMHYKYEYEYVTTNDFDEIIFPRDYNLGIVEQFKQLDCNNKSPVFNNQSLFTIPQNYSIYNYAKKMFLKYGTSSSCLLFDHFIFTPLDSNFFENVAKFVISEESSRLLTLTEGTGKKSFLQATSSDTEYMKYMLKMYNIFKCLKTSYMNNTVFELYWNNAFTIRDNRREGKSIYNTDTTEGINQHFASNTLFGSKVVRIPNHEGISSHFREDVGQFFSEQKQSIRNIRLDIEYYYFLINF